MTTNAVKAAEKAYDDAASTVTEWEDKARAARSEAAELDADSGAAILADPTAAREIAVKINEADLQARAYDGAAATARQQLDETRRRLIEAWADEYDRRAKAAEDKAEKQSKAIDDLVEQIRELDGGHPWTIQKEQPVLNGPGVTASKLDLLEEEAAAARQSAGYCRHVLQHGGVRSHPADLYYFATPPAEPFDKIGRPIRRDVTAQGKPSPQQPAPAHKGARADRDEFELDPEWDADLIELGAK